MTRSTPEPTEQLSPVIYLTWLVPGIPLVWGVWQTLIKVAQLFQ
ncbi:hypothetical protein GCM10008959_00930 [Deinococcus seoulensis]|uniref:Oxalate:formate antiporter n=3 Tax=Deinococcus TaxID=1298 RepID=A0ABY7V1H0_9DEIO|nr:MULTISPECIES: hypothetical protein [Deinococcus]WDA58449.1 hypothetical protein M8445_14035 [Deinococcus aquaticus]GGR43865.1 hypothetical protein GCM10008959_00930 [Deinococcus seoulensis]GGS23460.1 hypothetical protein GCM10008961_13620 [Deinococcus knuensis]